MNASATARSPYWDIVKGVGIITIVLGHSCYFAVMFVYLFHLALFFFVSGFLYNEKKYGDAPFAYFGNRFAGAWPRYVFYSSCFVLLHNFFVMRGLYAGQELYNRTKTLAQLCNNLSFSGMEPAQGALWFIPSWLAASGLFGGAVWFGRTLSVRINKPKLKLLMIAFACASMGASGIFLNMRNTAVSYNLQASLTVVPIYFFAYLLRLYVRNFKKYTTWYGCAVSAGLLYYISEILDVQILLDGMIIPGIWFYAISLIGIYFCLCLGTLIEKSGRLSMFLAFLGRYSFEIMALHFAVFKLVDYLYATLWLRAVPDSLSGFPIGFSYELWPVYLITGTLIPALIGWISTHILRFLFSTSS